VGCWEVVECRGKGRVEFQMLNDLPLNFLEIVDSNILVTVYVDDIRPSCLPCLMPQRNCQAGNHVVHNLTHHRHRPVSEDRFQSAVRHLVTTTQTTRHHCIIHLRSAVACAK
jgi:hypothetical protein